MADGYEVDVYRIIDPEKKPSLQAITTKKFIGRDGNGIVYNIGAHQVVEKMKRNFMG